MTFRIHNIKLTLRFGFFAVLAVVLTLDGGAHVLSAFLAVTVHEAGHILAAKLCGMQIKSVTFGALGIHMAGETASVSAFRRAVVSLAGPLANLLGFLLLLPLPRAYPAVQLTLFAFHVLPAVPLDGGTALYCLLCGTFGERTAERTVTVLSVLLALTLGTLGFSVLLSTGYNFTLLVLAVYILFYLILKQRGNLC